MERGVFEIDDTESLVPKKMYKARADAKEPHGMRYTRYTGLAQAKNWVKLKFAAMNLKKFAKWNWRGTHFHSISGIMVFHFPIFTRNPSLA